MVTESRKSRELAADEIDRADARELRLEEQDRHQRALEMRLAEGFDRKEDHLSEIMRLVAEAARIAGELDRSVAQARIKRASWAEIGRAAGVSAQAANLRWTARGRERDRRAKAQLRERARGYS